MPRIDYPTPRVTWHYTQNPDIKEIRKDDVRRGQARRDPKDRRNWLMYLDGKRVGQGYLSSIGRHLLPHSENPGPKMPAIRLQDRPPATITPFGAAEDRPAGWEEVLIGWVDAYRYLCDHVWWRRNVHSLLQGGMVEAELLGLFTRSMQRLDPGSLLFREYGHADLRGVFRDRSFLLEAKRYQPNPDTLFDRIIDTRNAAEQQLRGYHNGEEQSLATFFLFPAVGEEDDESFSETVRQIQMLDLPNFGRAGWRLDYYPYRNPDFPKRRTAYPGVTALLYGYPQPQGQ